MSEAPVPEVDETGEDDHAPAVPEPPHRVPFGIAMTTTLLGVVTLTSLLEAALTTEALFDSDTVADSVGWGLLMALGALGAALTAAVAWSFARNGKTVGVQVVGGLVVLAGLAALIDGVARQDDPTGVGTGVFYLALGLSLIVVPLLGDGPVYLAARRVWSDAERAWLRSLVTPDAPPALPFQHQPWPAPPQQHQPWPTQPPPHQPWPTQPPAHQPWPAQQQPWAAPPQPGQTPHPQYQYPPQQPPQAWAAPHPQHYQAWPDPTTAGPAWSAQPPPPTTDHPDPSAPRPAAQQAPTEAIHAQPPPPHPTPPEPTEPTPHT